jgi:hypothetical protein
VSSQAASRTTPIGSSGEARQVVENLERIMDALLATVEDETRLVRAGHLSDAGALESAKAELAGEYLATTERLKANKQAIATLLPDTIESLRRRHDAFHALLQINLTVLATAHAVSEGIIRGVSDELARKQVPQTYGATGKPSAPGRKISQPLAISRSL